MHTHPWQFLCVREYADQYWSIGKESQSGVHQPERGSAERGPSPYFDQVRGFTELPGSNGDAKR
jgi:hypothetical protein